MEISPGCCSGACTQRIPQEPGRPVHLQEIKESGEDRGVGDVSPRLWESCSVLVQRANKTELEVPRNEGNEVNREGCAGVLARNMTEEAGELIPTGPGGGKDESGERNCWRSR